MTCTSREHEQNMLLTGDCPACGCAEPRARGISPLAQEVIDALTKRGGPVEEMTQRCRRIETRVTNMLRAIGMSPGCTIPDPKRGTAVCHDGAVHVSSPEVTLAEVAVAAVRGNQNKPGVMPVIVCNQPWGHVYINGKE